MAKGEGPYGGRKPGAQGPTDKKGGGTPYQPQTPKLPSIPKIPDTNGGAVEPEPVDLSLLAGQDTPPERRPLNNGGVGGSLIPQTGITGLATRSPRRR
jgi:hypothetical protein